MFFTDRSLFFEKVTEVRLRVSLEVYIVNSEVSQLISVLICVLIWNASCNIICRKIKPANLEQYFRTSLSNFETPSFRTHLKQSFSYNEGDSKTGALWEVNLTIFSNVQTKCCVELLKFIPLKDTLKSFVLNPHWRCLKKCTVIIIHVSFVSFSFKLLWTQSIKNHKSKLWIIFGRVQIYLRYLRVSYRKCQLAEQGALIASKLIKNSRRDSRN